MLARKITKTVVRSIVGISASYVVASALNANINPTKTLHKVEAKIGGMVIGGMVADRAGEWSDKMIDELFDLFTPEDTPTDEIAVA